MTSWPDRRITAHGSIPGEPRDPVELLRTFTAAVASVAQSQTPSDVFEGLCRALSEHGIIASVFGTRGGSLALVAHRLGDIALRRPLSPAVMAPAGGARAYSAGEHPIFRLAPAGGIPAVPAVDVAVCDAGGRPVATVCLLAAGLSDAHLPAVEVFAALLGATTIRVEMEARLREVNTRLEQRVRARTEELTSVYELSSALCTAATDRVAAQLTTMAAARHLPCDAAATLLCADGWHTLTVAARGIVAPRFREAMLAKIDAELASLTAFSHDTCRLAEPVHAGHPQTRPGIALDGTPATLISSPVTSGDGAVGLVLLAGLRTAAYSAEQLRLLQTFANQLGIAVERLRGARSAERERLSALIDGLRDGVVLLDREGNVLAGNPAGRALLDTLEPAELRAVLTTVHQALDRGEPSALELTAPGDRTRHIAISAAPIVDDTGQPAAALALHDATEETLIRERLFQSEKMASVGQLVSGVAHELNNPLTGISGFAQLLLARGLDPERERHVTTIYEEAERASKIVQNLLSFARRRPPAKSEVDLNVLIQRVLELRDYDLRVHDIEVQRSFTEPLPACLADPHQIQQVLLNVITNAEHAIRAGGRPGLLQIATMASGDRVRVVIADNGTGIADEHRRRLFDPFFTTKPVGEGTGLGLTISYGIIEEHGGRIEADNTADGGAVFTIDLPAIQRLAGAPEAEPPAPEPPAPRRAILVVDDEPSIRELLAGLLLADGHQVETVRTGAEALARLAERSFDAIITDIRMPEMDGMVFYDQLLQRFPQLQGKVIFTSGDTVSPDTRAFIDTLGAPFFSKPFKLREVRDLVRAVTEQTA